MRLDVGLDDVRIEVVTEVEDVVFDPQVVGDSAGIVDIADRAAPLVGVAAPQLHGDTDDVVALLL